MPRRGWVAVVLVAMTVGALVLGAAPAGASGTSVVTGLSWTSPSRGWAVGTNSVCADPSSADNVGNLQCVEQVFSTTNRGRTWTGVGSTDGVVNIRFANTQVGYSFGARNSSTGFGDSSGFAMTTDGGRNWVPQPGPKIAAVETVGTRVVRITSNATSCPGPAKWSIETSRPGSGTWRKVRVPPMKYGCAEVQLVRGGRNDLYAAFFGERARGNPDQTTQLIASHDGGLTWTTRSDPCGGSPANEMDTIAIGAATRGVVASLCYPRVTRGGGYIKVSRNGSRTYGRARLIPDGLPAYTIAITSLRDLLLSDPFDHQIGGPRLYASHNGGDSWRTVITETPSGFHSLDRDGRDLLGVSGPTSAYWVGNGQTVWTTTNDGRSFTMNAAPGG